MLDRPRENPLPASDAGWRSWLSQRKGAAPQEVVSAIRSVYSGQRYIASETAQQSVIGRSFAKSKRRSPAV